MKLVLVLCFLGLSLGAGLDRRLPRHCKSPPLMTGAFTQTTQNEELWYYSPYEYDAVQQRIRIYRVGSYHNQSFTYDALLLFTEGVMFEIDSKASTCTKKPLTTGFQPMHIPADASLLGQYVVGSSSGPGEGLLVNTWIGEAPDGAQYMMTMTEVGCFPVNVLYKTKEFGWVSSSFINGVRGIVDPNVLNPPSFCPGPEAQPEGKPVDFFTLFRNTQKQAV